VHFWQKWQTEETVATRLKPIIESDSYHPTFMEKYLSFGTQQGSNDIVARRVPHLNPKKFESITDIFALENRIQEMLIRSDLTENQRIAGEQYLKSMQRIHEGKYPDGFFRDD
jgi:hypothetical protein